MVVQEESMGCRKKLPAEGESLGVGSHGNW